MTTYEVTGLDDNKKEVTVLVKKPTSKDMTEARLSSNQFAAALIKSGKFITRQQLKEQLIKTGEIPADIDEQLTKLGTDILVKERLLAKGGAAGLTKSKGRAIALDISDLRKQQLVLIRKTQNQDYTTLEAQTENVYFDALVSLCLLDESGERLWKSVEDYQERDDVPEYVVKASMKLMEVVYGGSNEDTEKDLPENKFLIKYKFVNEDLKFINKDGHLVDRDGRLVNDEGRYVNEKGELIDLNNNPVDTEGNPIEEFQEFLDD